MTAHILFDSLWNSKFSNIFCFEKEFINLSCYTGTFLVGAHWFGVPFPKLQTFSRIFCVLPIDYSLYEKIILGFWYIYLFAKLQRNLIVNFLFYRQCNQAATHLICERAILAQNASIVF